MNAQREGGIDMEGSRRGVRLMERMEKGEMDGQGKDG